MDELGFSSAQELQDAINKLHAVIQRSRDKMQHEGKEDLIQVSNENLKVGGG